MWLGLELSESMAAQVAANAGTSPLTVLNVQLPFPLTVLYTWVLRAELKILTASGILKGTVTTSTKERYALDSGSVIVRVIAQVTPTQDTFQFPGFSLKKFLKLSLRARA